MIISKIISWGFFLETSVSTILGLLIGHIMFWMGKAVPAKRKWNLLAAHEARFVIATSAEIDTGTYVRFTTGLGQVLAIGKLLPSFTNAYSNRCDANIQFSETFNEHDLKLDLIVVGGVKNNRIARRILEVRPDLPYTQKTINNIDVIIDVRRNQQILGKYGGGKVVEDFGLIVSIPNPYNSKTRAILFLSVHTYGLDAAADAFVNNIDFWTSLRHRNYVCLVKCKVSNSVIHPPEILDFCNLKG